jgi:short-subunit dehydrogenase
MRNNIIITGAASGLGKSLAEKANAQGYQLWLTDKNHDLVQIAEKLNAKYLVVDLAKSGAAHLVFEWASDVNVLINNAGIATRGVFDEISIDSIGDMLAVNIIQPTLLAHLFLNKWKAEKIQSCLVNISSSASYFPTPGLGPYGPTKAYCTSLSLGLIEEYRSNRYINVLGILPTGIDTNFQKNSGVKKAYGEKLLDPNEIATLILKNIGSKKSKIIHIGILNWVFMCLQFFLPHQCYSSLIGRLINNRR